MNVCERLSREHVSLADLDDTQDLRDMDDLAKVGQFTQAMLRGASVPPLYVIRQRGALTLIHGGEQISAANELGHIELDAFVFEVPNDAAADLVGSLAFDLAELLSDEWSSRMAMAA
jgi:hypothetical protein